MLLYIVKSVWIKITSIISSTAFGRDMQLGKRLLFHSFPQKTMQFCLSSHKSVIDAVQAAAGPVWQVNERSGRTPTDV